MNVCDLHASDHDLHHECPNCRKIWLEELRRHLRELPMQLKDGTSARYLAHAVDMLEIQEASE